MRLRICLALSILASIGVVAVGHFQLRPHIQGIMDVRDQNHKEWQTWLGKAKGFEKNLKETKATLDKTEKDLANTRTERDAANTSLTDEKRRSDDLKKRLERTDQSLNAANQELSRWQLLGLTIDQIRTLQDLEKSLRVANDGLKAENIVLGGRLKIAMDRLAVLLNPDEPQPLPAGTKGKILVVDPKWNFVVLNIGEKEQLVTNGVLTVHRSGKLVAKVKIVSIQGPRSIANVMPGWKLEEILEGDSVFY